MIIRSPSPGKAPAHTSSRTYALFAILLLLLLLFAYQQLPTESHPAAVELVEDADASIVEAPAPAQAALASQEPALTPAAPSARQPAGLVLKGIFADGSGGGSIILGSTGGEDRVARNGSEIAPGLRLTGIYSSYALMTGSAGSMRMEIGKGPFLPVLDPSASAGTWSGAEAFTDAPRSEASQPLGLTPVRTNGRIEGFAITPATSIPQLQQAGLKVGDVLVAVNGQAFESTEKVLELSNEIATSRTAEFEYVRQGKRLKSTLRIN